MALPRSLIGLLGMIIFITFLIGEITIGTPIGKSSNEDIKALRDDLRNSVNSTVASDNIFTGIFYAGGTALAGINLILNYILIFLGYDGVSGLPDEFFIFFSMVAIGLMLAIYRFIRGQLDQ